MLDNFSETSTKKGSFLYEDNLYVYKEGRRDEFNFFALNLSKKRDFLMNGEKF